MKLNKNSVNARLYRWFYNVDLMPRSICPYFWKLILMWLLVIPYCVWLAPVYIIHRLTGERILNVKQSDKFEYAFITNSLLFISIILLLGVSSLFVNYENVLLKALSEVGVISLFTSLFIIILLLFLRFITRPKKLKMSDVREDKPSIILEFIKSKYNKMCTVIDWK